MNQALSAEVAPKFVIADYVTRSPSHGGTGSEDYINKGTKQILDQMHDLGWTPFPE